MVSLKERESAEKTCSASNALHNNRSLVLGDKVKRYLAPPPDTAYPLEYAFHLLGDVNGKTVLEYGCGDGPNMVVLARRGARVVGLEISSEMLARARERLAANECDGAMLVLGSAHALPLPDASVDVVFGISILHHLDLEIASREVRRVLKEDGRAIFLEPVRNSRLLMHVRKLFPKRAGASPFERPLTDEEIRDFAAQSGYQGRTFHLILSRLANKLPIFKPPLLALCQYVDALLLRLFPSLNYYASINVFRIEARPDFPEDLR
jgi:SAM-dependent methyltransferase